MEHFKRDRFLTGFITGLLVPVAAYGLLLTLYDFIDQSAWMEDRGLSLNFRERSMALFALCANLIPFHYFRRKHADNAMRGMIVPTILYVVLWFYLFGRQMLDLT